MLSKIAMAATVFAAGWGTGSGEPCTNAGGDCAARVHFPGEWPTSIWHSAGGYIRLGVLDLGHLNYDDGADGTIGLRYIDHDGLIGAAGTEYDSTSAGCDCEGWGAAYSLADGSRVSGKANDANGITNVALNGPLMSSAACMDPATHGPATCHEATADARVDCLVVKHHYYSSDKSDFAFNVDVTLMNNCGQDITNLRYARTMDWDIEPNAFNEQVYLNPGNAVDILCVNDDGFRSGNPDDGLTGVGINFDGCAPQGVETDAGVRDHGAQFVFEFQSINATNPLADGSAHTFRTYYGASHDEASARNEMAKLGDVEAYTLGVYAGPAVGPTHFFGFAGVGGTVVTPPVTDADVLTAPCECTETVVSSSGAQVELRFSEDGPYDAECA